MAVRLFSGVETVSLRRAGMVGLCSMAFVITPPRVSNPTESGVTSSSTPSSTWPWPTHVAPQRLQSLAPAVCDQHAWAGSRGDGETAKGLRPWRAAGGYERAELALDAVQQLAVGVAERPHSITLEAGGHGVELDPGA